VAIAIDEAIRGGLIKKNDLFITVAFGGGLTWAGALIEY
jgi:3-oxoacyl-[acyl-carrier-protein] synthase-3